MANAVIIFDSQKFARRKYPHSQHLSRTLQIMAAMPQLTCRESNKQRKVILCQIKEMAPTGGIS
jgi:hypothetical protein